MSYPTPCNPSSTDPDDVARRYQLACAEIRARIRMRNDRAYYLTMYARSRGLDADYAMVSKHLQWFESWHSGLTRTGHLMNRTGVKYMVEHDDKEGS